jgi:hypothetical protein
MSRLVTGGAVLAATLVAAAPAAAAGRPIVARPAATAAALPHRHVARPTALRVADPAAYARAKRGADRAAGRGSAGSPLAQMLAPVSSRNWAGISDSSGTPSDSTGAIGTTRYIELINSRFAIYSRTSNTPLATGTLGQLGGDAAGDTFDPQIIWDPTTSRFYYAMDDIVSPSSNLVLFGWSKTATPASAADFCKFQTSFGVAFPDFPKLGDTADFLVVGINRFSNNSRNGTFVSTDMLAFAKPAPGTACTSPATGVIVQNLKDAAGRQTFTAVPANQIDSSSTGYAVARARALPATILALYRITKNANGTANIQQTGTNVSVPSYTFPASAPSPGVTQKIDTADARPTQAVLAVDPARGASAVALWTQHTVNGGAGARVRWYEINPVTHATFQTGAVAPSGLFAFNAAISPDRQVNGTTARFGSNMLLDFNTSSPSANPAIKAVSKIGTAAVSAPLTIKTSAAGYRDFACTSAGSICRWGDYAAATPDPATAAGATRGVVWGTSQWNISPAGTSVPWRTQNFALTP